MKKTGTKAKEYGKVGREKILAEDFDDFKAEREEEKTIVLIIRTLIIE